MAYAESTRHAGVEGLNSRFADLSARWKARLERNRRYRRTFNELNALSNRELADLGMSRAMLRSVAWESSAKG